MHTVSYVKPSARAPPSTLAVHTFCPSAETIKLGKVTPGQCAGPQITANVRNTHKPRQRKGVGFVRAVLVTHLRAF